MTRVAWLSLPDFPIDRLRRLDRKRPAGATPPSLPPEPEQAEPAATPPKRGGGWRPGARWARDEAGSDAWLDKRLAKKRAQKAALLAQIEQMPAHQRPPMRELGRRSEPAPMPFRGLAEQPRRDHDFPVGRNHGFPPRHDFDAMARGEPPHPFRPMPPDEGRALAACEPSDFGGHVRGKERPPYDLENAFWEQGRVLGPLVTKAVAGEGPRPRPAAAIDFDQAPLVTAVRDGNRMLVGAACPLARALGLVAGMAITQARAMVPGLDIRPADPAGDAADLARLAAHAARHWTPLAAVAAGASHGLVLDITGSAHLFGGEARFCRRIQGLCRRLGLVARIAVADTAAAARALALHGGEALILCPPGGAERAVADLPVAGLGLETRALHTLARLGVERIGQLATMPRAPLARRFGRVVVDVLDRLRGARAEPIDPLVPHDMPVAEHRFAEPIGSPEAIGRAIELLAADLCAMLAERGLGARALLLECERIDRDCQRIALGFARGCRDPLHMCRLLAMRIEEIAPGFGLERMRLAATRADPLCPQPLSAALGGEADEEALAALVDRLVTRLGSRRLYRQGMVESEVPERSCRRHDPLAAPPGWSDPWPRPVRLLNPAEPVQHVMADTPDYAPRRFEWRGTMHHVVRGDGPERIHGEWWRRAIERDAVRDYFQVEDDAGARFWLYRRGDGLDGRTGDMSWHLHGVFG